MTADWRQGGPFQSGFCERMAGGGRSYKFRELCNADGWWIGSAPDAGCPAAVDFGWRVRLRTSAAGRYLSW